MFYSEQTQAAIDLAGMDYVADAIDSMRSKILLIQNAYNAGLPVIQRDGGGEQAGPFAFPGCGYL